MAKQAPDEAKNIIVDVDSCGVYSTMSSYYKRYEPVSEHFTFEAWQMILSVPYVPQVVNIVVQLLNSEHYNTTTLQRD